MNDDSQRPAAHADAQKRDNRRMVTKLAVVVGLMFCFGYALVPIYNSICRALGVNVLSLSESDVQGETASRSGNGGKLPANYKSNTQVDTSRSITIEFDANARGPWSFKPAIRSVVVHPGELTTVMYEFRNEQNRTMSAQAIPSYAPAQAMPYFNKLECFCFNQYTLKPGESKTWPVVFVIDPKLSKDVKTITLSYTFFEVGGKVPAEPEAAALATPAVPLMTDDSTPAVRKISFIGTMKTVAWSFFGVRKGADHEREGSRLNPVHVAIAGVIGALLFVGALLLLVNWVLANGFAK